MHFYLGKGDDCEGKEDVPTLEPAQGTF